MIGRRQRLIFEDHVAEADFLRNAFQYGLRLGVRRIVAIDKAHGPAMHHLIDLAAEKRLCALLQMPHEHLDHFGEPDAPAADGGRFVDQGRAQDRFEGPHEPAFMLADIGVDRRAAEQDAALGFKVEEDRAGDQRFVAFDGSERQCAVLDDAQRRVGSPEIQSARRHEKPLPHHNGAPT